MSPFEKYSAFYDLLYRDKDYSGEAEYVARTVRAFSPRARTILELGSGTGRHGRLLAQMGYRVHGIERSPDMVSLARSQSDTVPSQNGGAFTCEVGDICKARVGRTFDVAISLFHVISYQTTNDALRAAFRVAAEHLEPAGLFVFDVWHGPAVLTQQPTVRIKEVADERYGVKRTSRPRLDTNRGTVNVVYDMECEDKASGAVSRFSEEHLMRYLFPTEVEFLADAAGFRCVATEEFLTGVEPSPFTWGVMYVLQKSSRLQA